MWTVVYTAQEKDYSDEICSALKDGNILVKRISATGENKFDVLVPSAEVEKAHDIMIDLTF